jgi:hypothetical protein
MIGKREQPRVQRLVHHRRHRLRRVATPGSEVPAADVADEQRVTGENFLDAPILKNEPRHAFGSVAGRLDRPQLDGAEADGIAVVDRAMRELRFRSTPEDDLRARSRGELVMTADEIGVQMRLDDVPDPDAAPICFSGGLIDIALRIDDSGIAAVADQVRRVSETAEVELLEYWWSVFGIR